MGAQTYGTVAQRIGKLKGEILRRAIPKEVLGLARASNKEMPKNNSKTVVFRRWLPLGGVDNQWITGANVDTYADDHLATEGVTPTGDTIAPTDITVVMKQYAVLYSVTDQTVDFYEDDIPEEMKKQTGDRVGLVREMVRYGALKAATNKYYAGGVSRVTVDESISLNLLRKVTRSLLLNHASLVTEVLSASPNYATTPVEAGFLVFGSTDMEANIRNLPGFKHISEYGQRKVISPDELGSVERFRFILSPELAAYINAGAAVGSTGLYSTGGANVDVYPLIVAAEDAWGQVALRGVKSLDVTWLPPGTKDKNDPLGQRGYIGAKAYMVAVILNQGWMAVVECGATDLA